jgi:hypothetical protein
LYNDISPLDDIQLDLRLLNISPFDGISLFNDIGLSIVISLLKDIGLLGGISLINITLSNDISLLDYISLCSDISWSNDISLLNDVNLFDDISLINYMNSSSISSCTRVSIQIYTRQEGPQGQKPGWPLKPLNIERNRQATRSVSAFEPYPITSLLVKNDEKISLFEMHHFVLKNRTF